MEQIITASDANRKFSQLLRGVGKGLTYLVTSHGKVVAKMIPPDLDKEEKKRDKAFKKLMAHLKSKPVRHVGKWTRGELYEDV
jgi:prevent-host-death family protein